MGRRRRFRRRNRPPPEDEAVRNPAGEILRAPESDFETSGRRGSVVKRTGPPVGRPAVFLDRDGVVNADSPDYVKGWHEFRFLPGSLDAMVRLSRAGWPILVVTNQSALARGLISPAGLADLHRRMAEAVRRAGGKIDGIYFCPHHPDDGCACRKPRPGLVERAAAEHGIDPARSWLVGDSERDIRCGEAAGVGRRILVRTGNGRRDEAGTAGRVRRVAGNLAEAADWILAAPARKPG